MQIRRRYFVLSLTAAMLTGSVLSGALLIRFWPAPASSPHSDLAKVEQVYSVLKGRYYTPVDQNKMVEGAINGMIKALDDPYTTYMTPQETDGFHESIAGSFEGIGAEIREEGGQIVIVSPIHGTPAEKAGLKPNDVILEVNGVSLSGLKSSEAVLKIRGPKGSTAKLRIRRPGLQTPFEVSIVRDTIPITTVNAKMLGAGMGHVQLTRFSEQTAVELEKAIADLQAQGAKGIVLDLRHNPGGLLNVAVKVSELFVPKDQVVLQVRYRNGQVEQHRSTGRKTDLPVVVLIDGGSASAAEIVAGALQESAGIPLVGETTFGKGTVQTAEDMGDKSSLKYTIAEWLTPKGNQINKQGIKPDVGANLPDWANLPYPAVEENREYKEGDRADVVRILQVMLRALGYDPGRADGLLDQGTAAALKGFQAAHGLAQSGTVNQPTALKATELLRVKLRENDTQLARAQEALQELLQKR